MADQSNPFFNMDWTKMDMSKFMDFSQYMKDFKVPGMPVDGLMDSQRKNVEALTSANKLAMESAQALAKRQSEVFQEMMSQLTEVSKGMMASGGNPEKVEAQTKAVQGLFESSLKTMKEMADMVAASNKEVFEVLNKRMNEGVEEMKTAVDTAAKGGK